MIPAVIEGKWRVHVVLCCLNAAAGAWAFWTHENACLCLCVGVSICARNKWVKGCFCPRETPLPELHASVETNVVRTCHRVKFCILTLI